MPIHFYLPREDYGWLSNFSPHGIEVDGKWWPTVEHYFQAPKFTTTDPEYAESIRSVRKPRDAKRLGNNRGRPLRRDWEHIKDAVMRLAVRRKFETHMVLRRKLLDTGDERLIERTTHDRYWGSGSDGRGSNKLGVILMEVRAALRELPIPPQAPRPGKRKRRGRT